MLISNASYQTFYLVSHIQSPTNPIFTTYAISIGLTD